MLGERFPLLLERARTGDENAWGELYDDLAGPLHGYLRGRGAPEPEDQLGDTFLDVARNIGAFVGDEAGFRSWVFTIAHRRCIDALRSRGRRPVAPLAAETLEPLADAVGRGSDDVADLVGRLADAQLLERLLGVLTEDQREVLMLRFAADLDVATVAAMTGRTNNAVAALTLRALRTLQRTLANDVVPDPQRPSSSGTGGR